VRAWALDGGTDRGFLAFFERDPERAIPSGNNIVVPADGLLLSIDRRGETQYVVSALSYWDVHVQRVPCDGVVTSVSDAGGGVLFAALAGFFLVWRRRGR